MKPKDTTNGTTYVKSLNSSVKRRFAGDYWKWIQTGRVGMAPSRGALSQTTWRTICTNLDWLS